MRSHQDQNIEILTTKNSLTIQKLNESFNFDWNDYRTIKPNEGLVDEITLFIENLLPPVEKSERYALAQLCYKLGTYYNHIKREPERALKNLLIAGPILEELLRRESMLVGSKLAWAWNHIAYSFQQKLAVSVKEKDTKGIKVNSEYAHQFYNKTIKNYGKQEHLEAIKLTAFAYCVKASTEHLDGDLNSAISSYQFALDLYEKHEMLDDQYARAKKCYADLLTQQGHYEKAIITAARKTYEALEKYWETRQDKLNPYFARFNISHGNFLDKFFVASNSKQRFHILDKYQKAYESLLLTDGDQSSFTNEIGKKVSEIKAKIAQSTLLGSVIPAYRNRTTGEIYVGLICNTKNLEVYSSPKECLEEMGLDLNQFPQNKVFLISDDGPLAISQENETGKASNRSDQYMVFLGDFDKPPTIKSGDNVEIADWVNVSQIQRKHATEYMANEKQLSGDILHCIESGLKEIWSFLLQQASAKNLRSNGGKSVSRFSIPENIAVEIELFCDKNSISIEGTSVANFLRYISGDLPNKTYTGKFAQTILNCLLETTQYLMNADVSAKNFIPDLTKILVPLESSLKVYSNFSDLLQFKQAPKDKSTSVSTDKSTQTPRVGMNILF